MLFFPDTFKCSFETLEIERAGSLGAIDQLSWIPEFDCILFVANRSGASGSVALNGKTNRENRSIIGIVDVEISLDEF